MAWDRGCHLYTTGRDRKGEPRVKSVFIKSGEVKGIIAINQKIKGDWPDQIKKSVGAKSNKLMAVGQKLMRSLNRAERLPVG